MTTVEPIQFNQSSIVFNNMGIDTIRLIANYETVVKLVERMGLTIAIPSKNSPVNETIIKIEESKDKTHRYN